MSLSRRKRGTVLPYECATAAGFALCFDALYWWWRIAKQGLSLARLEARTIKAEIDAGRWLRWLRWEKNKDGISWLSFMPATEHATVRSIIESAIRTYRAHENDTRRNSMKELTAKALAIAHARKMFMAETHIQLGEASVREYERFIAFGRKCQQNSDG